MKIRVGGKCENTENKMLWNTVDPHCTAGVGGQLEHQLYKLPAYNRVGGRDHTRGITEVTV